jgi:cell division initiation protein
MKLTPLDVRHKEFRRTMRGYSDEEVDVFLDEVADEFERLFQANIELGERLHLLEEQAQQFENLKDTLNKTLVSAQQQADETRANAHKEAELILRDAELKGRDALADSYREKQRVQQALVQLRHVEEDFRFKFRSLLEAHLNLLVEDETSEERRHFRGLVAGVEEDLGQNGDASPGISLTEMDPSASLQDAHPNGGARGTGETAPLSVSGDAEAKPLQAEQPAIDDSLAPDASGATEPGRWGATFQTPASTPENDSGVRRFLFGRQDNDADMLPEEAGRDFEW